MIGTFGIVAVCGPEGDRRPAVGQAIRGSLAVWGPGLGPPRASSGW